MLLLTKITNKHINSYYNVWELHDCIYLCCIDVSYTLYLNEIHIHVQHNVIYIRGQLHEPIIIWWME